MESHLIFSKIKNLLHDKELIIETFDVIWLDDFIKLLQERMSDIDSDWLRRNISTEQHGRPSKNVLKNVSVTAWSENL